MTIGFDTSGAHVRIDLDRRVELVPTDRFCGDITVALYLAFDGLAATVHSYSRRAGVAERLAWIADAMEVLAGMRAAGTDGRSVAFACGSWHELAARRAFLEACKLDPATDPAPRPLEIDDTRTGQHIAVEPLRGGAYAVTAAAADPNASSRAPAVAAGLAKLAGLTFDADDATRVQFPCGASHDRLVGLLLPRAINVRVALLELEQSAARGVLVAPSAQRLL